MNPKVKSTFFLRSLLAGMSALFLIGCSYPDQFSNVKSNEAHAILTADKGDHWRDSGPSVFNLNSQPTSFWRSTEHYRIPLGRTTLDVIADSEPYSYDSIEFDAVKDRHYHLRYSDGRSSVSLYDVTDSRKSILVTKVFRKEAKSTNQAQQVAAPDGQ